MSYKIVIKDFAKTRADVVALTKGDLIEVLGADNKGWFKGKNVRLNETGWASCACCEPIALEEAKKLLGAVK